MRLDLAQSARPLRLIAGLALVSALYFARELLIPLALAVLLTLLLSPLVWRLRRMGLPRGLAVTLVVSAAGIVTLSLGALVLRQAFDLTAKLPDYQINLVRKVRDLKTSGGTTFGRVTGTLNEIQKELVTTQPATAPATSDDLAGTTLPATTEAPPDKPVKVEVIESAPSVGEMTSMIAGPLMPPLAALAVTSLVLIFLLYHSSDVRDRLIWLAGMRQISLTTSAADETATRIGKYLRMQLVINLIYGVLVFLGMTIIGVPNSLLWATLAVILRFVPYIGPWVAAVLPTLLVAAVFPGWGRALACGGMFAVVEFVTNMILEPWLYSTSTGISSLGVVLAAVFWGWLWGPVGLVLAVPMTVCLVVLGKHVPQLALFQQLLGAESSVPMVGRLYQRLLVGDESSAAEIVSQNIGERRLAEVCDELLLPVLQEMKHDMLAGRITRPQVREALAIFDGLTASDPDVPVNGETARGKLLCIAGQNEVDESAARLLATAAAREGIECEVVSSHALAGEVSVIAESGSPRFAAVVQVSPVSSTHTRRLVKTLLALKPGPEAILDVSVQAAAVVAPDSTGVRRERSFGATLARLVEMSSVVETQPPNSTEKGSALVVETSLQM